jgi:tetratricopeptide (TPR) repeat protein
VSFNGFAATGFRLGNACNLQPETRNLIHPMKVSATLEPRVIPTYPVGTPEKNPVFFEKRVYQGSDGKVYPVPFIDKVFDHPEPVTYQSARLENEFVRLVMLPEIGGRILIGQDKTNRDYDFFYRQDVIKPALVGLAGPWISGGVEFNWPQHHRPGTFMPADISIEEEADGARTIWFSEHDPLNRLKGMHGTRLRPGSSLIELRGRLYNRTPFTRTFLWWANVAAMVHDQYQSFFPPDVHYVADHAVRATSSFPLAENPYYGVDYQNRPGANDLGWYKNIPVPTSYMICQTAFDFFGGYDFKAGGGFVHVADRHIAPGKKQWTWGDHGFGYAWDRELTDANGPYIELMAGVFTDNQPDFSYLAPYETKTFSQFWWPIRGIGPVQQANEAAALRMVVRDDRIIELGLCVSSALEGARLVIKRGGDVMLDHTISLKPGDCWENHDLRFEGGNPAELSATLVDAGGSVVLSYRPVDTSALTRDREVATEPPQPQEIASSDELYLTGEHLELYRHPTRSPEPYWREALRRDDGDCRCNLAMGRRALRSGCLADAEGHLRKAVGRLIRRHPNPETGEAHYFLGVTLVFAGRLDEAYGWLAKAAWSQAWTSAANYQLACIDCRREDWTTACRHLDEAVSANGNHHQAQVLLAAVLRRSGDSEALAFLGDVLEADPLDHWARRELALHGEMSEGGFLHGCRNDAQTVLDLVFDYSDAGLIEEAVELLELHLASPQEPAAVPNPLSKAVSSRYVLAWLRNDPELLAVARRQSPDYFFPSRLHEQLVLEWALQQPGPDPVAAYGLGNYLYDRRRHAEAVASWQRSVADGAGFATVFRNLGIAAWNLRRDRDAARGYYLKALELDPADPRLVSEYDQLCAKLNDPLDERLDFLESRRDLVGQRDDCTVALAGLYNLTGNPARALEIVTGRRFHPWEGGEGSVLRQFTTAHILLGGKALADGDPGTALRHFSGAMDTPESLGEAYHLLQAKADVNYWTGMALKALGRVDEARAAFAASAEESGDFAEMAVTEHSPLSYYRGLSLRELGRDEDARALFLSLKDFALKKLTETARIDYFATSLPNLLVFDEDLQARRDAESHLLLAMAFLGLGEKDPARDALCMVRAFTNSDLHAALLSTPP